MHGIELFSSPCCDTITDTVRVTNVGIEDFTGFNNFSIYPNPANNLITLVVNSNSGSMQYNINVYDITGRYILQSAINNHQSTIDVSSFAEGIYVIQLQTPQGIVSKKFVKQ